MFPAIGYDPPDESHFTSRHYWEVGELNAQTRSGWMGRYLDVAGEPGNPLQGLSLDDSLAPALATARVPVAAVSSPADYGFWAYGLDEPLTSPTLDAFGQLGALARALARLRAGTRRVARHEHDPQPDRALRRTRRQTGLHLARHLPDRRRRLPAARLAALAAMLADRRCRSNASR